MMVKRLKGNIGDSIYFDAMMHASNGQPVKVKGKIVGVYDKVFLVQTPFGYRTTVSRIVTKTEEDAEGRELKSQLDKLINMSKAV